MVTTPGNVSLLQLVDPADLPRVPQQARSRAKRDAILAAALELFGARGYEAVGIEEIVTHAGSGVGTFYAYFRSKQQLLLMLVQEYLQALLGLNLMDLPSNADPLAAITEVVTRAFAPDRTYAGLWRAWREAVMTDSDLAVVDVQILVFMRDYVVVLIDRAAALGPLRADLDQPATATAMNALIWQLAQLHLDNHEEILRAVAHMMYHALFRDS